MMKFKRRKVAVVSTFLTMHSVQFDQANFAVLTALLLSQVRLMPVIGVIILASPRTELGLPPG